MEHFKECMENNCKKCKYSLANDLVLLSNYVNKYMIKDSYLIEYVFNHVKNCYIAECSFCFNIVSVDPVYIDYKYKPSKKLCKAAVNADNKYIKRCYKKYPSLIPYHNYKALQYISEQNYDICFKFANAEFSKYGTLNCFDFVRDSEILKQLEEHFALD